MTMSSTIDTGLYNIHLGDIEFPGGFGNEVFPLNSNKGIPIIAVETEEGYRLIDGWGRCSGLLNAGRETVQAILVSEGDVADRTVSGDDEKWNAEMYRKYAPQYAYPGSTN